MDALSYAPGCCLRVRLALRPSASAQARVACAACATCRTTPRLGGNGSSAGPQSKKRTDRRPGRRVRGCGGGSRWRARRSARARVWFKSEQLAIRVFERGLDFEGDASEPEHDHPDRLLYGPSPRRALPRALRFLGVSDRDTFVDFGCGKGRVVHQAAKRPFRRVIGVEISPALAEIARTNLATRRHQHRCPNVEIVVADAKEFRVPDDLTIAYFWHPFTGETLEAVLRGIVDSIDRHPRPVRLIYLGHHGAEVLATGRFRLLKEHPNRSRDRCMSNRDLRESLSGRKRLDLVVAKLAGPGRSRWDGHEGTGSASTSSSPLRDERLDEPRDSLRPLDYSTSSLDSKAFLTATCALPVSARPRARAGSACAPLPRRSR